MKNMLVRFSLYGFLKNQQYYDYFLILAFRQMGMTYFLIGIVIAFREIMINIMEIPTGAIADLLGRRKSMIFSFISYIISFLTFGVSGTAVSRLGAGLPIILPFIFLAMTFFGIGEAFRTGTHKAMIFKWLDINNRTHDTTRVYGYTRSWSKIGSAVSVLFASVFVFVFSDYIYVFFFAIIPYLLNIINFMGYPKALDGGRGKGISLKTILRHLKETMFSSLKNSGLKRLLMESMGFEGYFKVSKDYLQPILNAAALPLTVLLFSDMALTEEQRSVVLIGPVFFLLFILSAMASRNAHRILRGENTENIAAGNIWFMTFFIFLLLVPAAFLKVHWAMILLFIFLYIFQNLWRPLLISRLKSHCDEEKSATILSVESQFKSLSAMILAPVLGLAIDMAKGHNIGQSEFWPLGIIGAGIALAFITTSKNHTRDTQCYEE